MFFNKASGSLVILHIAKLELTLNGQKWFACTKCVYSVRLCLFTSNIARTWQPVASSAGQTEFVSSAPPDFLVCVFQQCRGCGRLRRDSSVHSQFSLSLTLSTVSVSCHLRFTFFLCSSDVYLAQWAVLHCSCIIFQHHVDQMNGEKSIVLYCMTDSFIRWKEIINENFPAFLFFCLSYILKPEYIQFSAAV